MVGDLGHRVDGSFLIWSRKSIRDEISFSLYISDIGGKFSYVRELVLLFYSLWICLFVNRGYQALMIREQRKRSAFNHGLKVPYRFEGG